MGSNSSDSSHGDGSAPEGGAARSGNGALRLGALITATVVMVAPRGPAAGPVALAVCVLLALLAVLWARGRPPRRQAWVGGLGFTLTVLLSAGAWTLDRLPAPSREEWTAAVESAYATLCDELRSAAESTAAALAERQGALSDDPEAARLEVFRYLQELTRRDEIRGLTLLYFDPDGEALAWAGEGLLHEPPGQDLPSSGLGFVRGYSALTLYAVAPLSDQRRPYRLMVGRSFATAGMPFLPAAESPWDGTVWSLGEAVEGGEETVRIAPAGAPALFVTRRPRDGEAQDSEAAGAARRFSTRWWAAQLRLAAAAVFGLMLLALAFLRGTAAKAVAAEGDSKPGATIFGTRTLGSMTVLAMSGMAVWALAARLGPTLGAALVASAGLAVWGLLRRRPASVRDSGGEILGALALVALALGAFFLQRHVESPDLAATLWHEIGDAGRSDGSSAPWGQMGGLRLTVFLAALGLLTLAARTRGPAKGDGAAWVSMLLLLAAGALHELPLAALALAAAGGGAAVRWLRSVDLSLRPMALGGVMLLAAAAGAVAWETAYRETFRQSLATEYLPLLAPPTVDEVNDIHIEINDHFEGLDLASVIPPGGGGVDPQDLAFVLWRDSPLPRRDGASALLVELAGGDRSSFAFRLPLDRDFEVSQDPDRWPVPPVESWRDAAIVGEAVLHLGGEPRGSVEYWFLPRPGFRLEVSEIDELEAALVRGEPRGRTLDGLPRPALFGLYSVDGRAISTPWEEAPPLEAAALEAAGGTTATPSGRSWYWTEVNDDLLSVLFLPRLSPLAKLERVGTHAVGTLAVAAVLMLWVLAVSLPPRDLRGLVDRTVRSYSKRLLLVYASLLLVPLVALNLVLLEGFETRLRQGQEDQGQAALASARLLLLDYLKGLGPGVGIDVRISRGLLEWISSVVRHQVTIYWGSRFYASSQQALYTAGLLPERIPGEAFSRLTLLGHQMESRTRRAGEEAYLELYAPLEEFGGSSQGLFLSVPLLEQEEEVGRELAAMRRRAVLVTTTIVFLLLAAGSRLAASFTKPIMELIGGTRKIAAGAPFLEVAPRELELSALADAIDEMARRIAEGRRELLLEKQVVERMVENITSGVVSLDHDRRVLLHNRVAAERLGTRVGVEIDRVLAGSERLEPVAEFLDAIERGKGGEIMSATVRLADEEGEMREWTLTWVPVPGPENPAALLVVDDDTEVLHGQRLEAWAEMARIIAHEIKNPLTPIRLSAEHLQQVYENDREHLDEIFERCTKNILKQVEELRDIASDFSIFSRIPRAELVDGDLVAAMREIIEAYRDTAYRDTSRRGVELGFHSDLAELQARFDVKLLGRAVRNLLENALRASAGSSNDPDGATATAAGSGEKDAGLVLEVERRGSRAVITVHDCGPGVDPDNLKRIFDPYFSTHETGTGLGLPIVQRIVEEHGGRVEARNRTGGGLAVTITIPLPEAA